MWHPLKERAAHEDRLIRDIYKELSKYDLVIGHNFFRFDWLYLKSRAILLKVERPKPPMCYDTMFAARRVGIKTTISPWSGKPTVALDHIIDYYGIPQLKTKIYPRRSWDIVWEQGFEKGIQALKEKVEHCIDDVKMTKTIYWHLFQDDPHPKFERLSY